MDFLKLEFWSDCSLGAIYYGTDMHFIIYLDADVEQMFFEESEEGQENGDGDFVPSFRRQLKRYKIITQELPEHMVDALYRMKLNDYIQLTWKTGEIDDIYNIQVEHEWFAEKTYAIVTITFDMDEKCVTGGCCTELTAVEITGTGTIVTADSDILTADSTVVTADAT